MPPPPAPDAAVADDAPEAVLSKQDKVNIEREQEQKLKAKFPNRPLPTPGGGGGGGAGGGGHSAFLQKRLAKGQKYFDSGDYNMAKQKPRGALGRMAIPVLPQPPTGDTIPTPDTVPARKTSIIQPLHDHSQSMHLASDPAHAAGGPTAPVPGQPLPNPAITKLAS